MTQVADAPGKSREHPGDPGTLLFENDRVRIWELVLKPGEVCNWHDHSNDHLLVIVDGCKVRDNSGDTEGEGGDIPDHQVFFVPGTPGRMEWPVNASSDRTLRELIIDLKDGPFESTHEFGRLEFFNPETPSTCWTP
jgi:hypothetical protein